VGTLCHRLIIRRGDRVIHFALQALQLHATPANPSPHTPEGLEELGPILNCGSRMSASSPSGSQTGSQSRSFVHFCVSRDGFGSGVRYFSLWFESDRKIDKIVFELVP
jgi:hypothetical protein